MTDANLCTVTGCDRPTHDGWYVCQTCSDELTGRLTDFAWMLDELDLVVSLQTRYAVSAGKVQTSDNHPLILNMKASEQRSYLVNAIATAARLVIDTHPEWREDRFWQSNRRSPKSEYVACAAWLSDRISGLRLHPAGGECRDEIMRHWVACEWMIDRPRDRRYLGTCDKDWEGNDCGGRIYQLGDKPEARCDTCSGERDADALREVLIREAGDKLTTASEAAMLAMMLGLPVGRTEVRRLLNVWINRGVVETRDHASENGHPRVRFSDVTVRLIERFDADDTPSKSLPNEPQSA